MPHVGSVTESDVPKDALRFTNEIERESLLLSPRYASGLRTNDSLLFQVRVMTEETKPLHHIGAIYDTMFDISGPQSRSIILETIKRGEDDDFAAAGEDGGKKTVILRLYESLGGRSKGTLRM